MSKRFILYRDVNGEHFQDMSRRTPDTSQLRRLPGRAPDASIEQILEPIIYERRALLAIDIGN